MFKGFKEFTYKMVAGANVATIIIMLLVGFSDFFQPEKFAALANLGLLFPVFLIVNLGFLLFWLLFRSKYAIIRLLDLFCSCPQVYANQLFWRNSKRLYQSSII